MDDQKNRVLSKKPFLTYKFFETVKTKVKNIKLDTSETVNIN